MGLLLFLLYRVIVVAFWLSALSLLCELIVVWLGAHPSKCRGDCCLCLTSCVEVVLLEREVVYFYFVFVKSSVEVPCVRSPVWTL